MSGTDRTRSPIKSRPADVQARHQSASFQQRGRHLRPPHSGHRGGRGSGGHPYRRPLRGCMGGHGVGPESCCQARTTAIITPKSPEHDLQSPPQIRASRRSFPGSRSPAAGGTAAPNPIAWSHTLFSGCRRPQEQPPPLGKEARPNQRGRNMGLARGVVVQASGCFLGGVFWGQRCSAVQQRIWELAVGCQSDLLGMEMRNACEMGTGKTKQWERPGGRKTASFSSISKKWASGGGGAWPTWPHFAGRRREVKLQVGLACGRRLAVGGGRDMRGQNLLASGMGPLLDCECDGFLGWGPGSWMTTRQQGGRVGIWRWLYGRLLMGGCSSVSIASGKGRRFQMTMDFPGEVEGRDGGGLWLVPVADGESRFFRNNAGTVRRTAHSAGSNGHLKLRRRTQIARGTSPPEVGACGTWRTFPVHRRPDLSARSYYCASPSGLPSRNPDSSSHLPFSQPNSAFYPHHNLHLKTQSLLTLSFAL